MKVRMVKAAFWSKLKITICLSWYEIILTAKGFEERLATVRYFAIRPSFVMFYMFGKWIYTWMWVQLVAANIQNGGQTPVSSSPDWLTILYASEWLCQKSLRNRKLHDIWCVSKQSSCVTSYSFQVTVSCDYWHNITDDEWILIMGTDYQTITVFVFAHIFVRKSSVRYAFLLFLHAIRMIWFECRQPDGL